MNTAAPAAPLRSKADSEPGTPDSPPGVAPLHRDYFERILPAPPIVCGRQLLPLSIGHYRLLNRFHCAFVSAEKVEATAGDLLIGVLVCSMRVEDFTAFAATPDFRKQLRRWASIFGFLPPRCFAWPIVGRLLEKGFGEITGDVDLRKILGEMEKFQAYITESQTAPRYWEETQNDRSSAAHWSQSIEATLREFQGWARAEINEEPLTKALWDYFKHCENQGLVRLMTDEEVAELDKPEDPEQTAAWLEYERLVTLAAAGKLDPNTLQATD